MIDAMKQALEALEMLAKWEHPASNITTKSGRIYPHHVAKNSAATLRLAIEQAEKQEPVAWMNDSTPAGVFARHKQGAENFGCTIPLYTDPPQREPHELLCVCGASWSIDSEGNEELLSTPPQRQPLTEEGLLNQNTELDKKLAELERINAQLLEALQQIIDLPEDSRIHYKVARRAIAAVKEKS